MSLVRAVYLGAILCGWMAFGGWFAAEILRQGVTRPRLVVAPEGPQAVARDEPRFLGSEALGRAFASERSQTIAAFCLVGAAIGAGLGLAGGLNDARLRPQLLRMARGLVSGAVGGFAGGWLGALIYASQSAPGGEASGGGPPWWIRPIGWMAAGAMVGLADGLFTLSRDRIRNGLIGGLVGGLIGGCLFDPIRLLVARAAGGADPSLQYEITSRAAGFVAVGFCIGAAVGLTHVLLRHAWLTVLDGDRPGRQVILTGGGLTLGNDPGAGLAFVGDADRVLLPIHLRIVRDRDGHFTLVPASPGVDAEVTPPTGGTRGGVSLKDRPGNGIALMNECVIKVGRNFIRFNERAQAGVAPAPSAAAPAPPPVPVTPSKPPLPHPSPDAPRPPTAAGAAAPPSRKTQPWGTTAPHKPAPPSPPAPRPPIAPAQPPPPAQRPTPQPRAANACPNGHALPAGQRYCIICDLHF